MVSIDATRGEEAIPHGARPGQPGKAPLLFDSFGRKPSASWQPHLRGVATTDPDHNQHLSATNCGQLSLAFGMVFLHHGYPVAKWV